MKPTMTVSGGDGLGRKLRELQERLTRESSVRVGIPAGAGSYEDGAPLAVIGAVQEFGSADGRIPQRSYLRVPLRANMDTYRQIIRRGVVDVVRGGVTSRALMEQVGARAAGDSQAAIEAGISPGNAESTIRRKGSATPLVDTGRLRQSITYEVDE